ncbi:MAG: hypothetical protein RRA34_00700 [Candidatus Calditenuis sp.]|jgi:UDP-N-acetylglucosamine--dolichyl-phosphate N-acetylglucosaminephosphotransferase|nr:hypothetical protein [Candidatus Calditenuis sp.]
MEAQQLLIAFSGIAVSTVLALVAVRLSMSLARRLNLLGRDVHKPGNVMVPKIGGLGMAVSYSVTLMLLSPRADALTLTLLASPILSAAIGLSEDFRELNPVLKPVLLALPGLVVIALGTYDPHPLIPFVGRARLTVVYPVLLVVAYSVVSNAVNSIDVVNGSLALFSIPIVALSIPVSLALGAPAPVLTAEASLLGSLLGFFVYNRYPARTFGGNVGSNLVSAAMVSFAVLGGFEVFLLVALLPAILNEAVVIASMGGLKSGKEVVKRPVLVIGGLIRDNPDLSAPLTIVRMLSTGGPVNESRVARDIGILSLLSSSLAVVTMLFAWRA